VVLWVKRKGLSKKNEKSKDEQLEDEIEEKINFE